MVSETGDVRNFLITHPLFQHLTSSQIEFVSVNMYVAFSKSGDTLGFHQSDQSGTKAGVVIVRSGSLEIRGQNGDLVDRLSSGDFIIPEVLFRNNSDLRVHVLEDCLYYELAQFAFHSLKTGSETFTELCNIYARTFQSRSEFEAPFGGQNKSPLNEPYLNHYVHEYMSAPPVCARPDITIRDAAQMMKRQNISSLLISESNQLVGIITDRDFRTRVLAENLTGNEPVKDIMTPDPVCIDSHNRLHEAQLKMMAKGIHHLPVTQENNPVGIISMSDILRANNIEPLSLIRSINHSKSVEELTRATRKLPDLVVKLIERDARATEVGEIITSFSDGITRQLIKLAREKQGPPPGNFCWLAFGSQARQEQMLGSDQDNGLLLPNDIDRNTVYFRELAEFVNEGLDRCGMPRCPGEIMACNEKWRLSLAQWKDRFDNWITQPSPHALMHASIFFDMRPIAGRTELAQALRRHVLEQARKNTIFLAMMCDNSLQHSPPLGFFKTFVLENDGDHNKLLELKKRGTIPIVDIARNYALSAGVTSVNTTARLHEIAQAGGMSKALATSLIDAHEFIAGIRLEAQGREFRAGKKIDNHLDPKELSPLVRHQLKEAFHLVREAQNAMKARFGGGVL